MNKKVLGLFAALAIFSFKLQAAEPVKRPDRCGAMHNLELRKAQDPGLEQRMMYDEQNLQRLLEQQAQNRSAQVTYTIPVVVHVVYKTTGQNISDAQVQSQIDVLNLDFGKKNADTSLVPAAWKSLAANSNFQFCLARTDPSGNPTTGIERRLTTTTSFNTNDNVKFYSSGGLDAWDVNRYFNIWVCNLSNQTLGYAEFPASAHTNTYGVVITYNSFGRTGVVSPPYDKGRTCTHEVGHAFSLRHIWGDDGTGSCSGSDYVNDTPNQADETYGCGTFPAFDNCSPSGNGYMWMNYMDYTDDACMYMFTAGQAARMNTAMTAYYPTLLSSTACETSTSIREAADNFLFSVYPNPSSGIINLDMATTRYVGEEMNVRVVDHLGRVVLEQSLNRPNGQVHQLDLGSQADGVYFLNLYNSDYNKTVRVTLAR